MLVLKARSDPPFQTFAGDPDEIGAARAQGEAAEGDGRALLGDVGDQRAELGRARAAHEIGGFGP